MPLSAKVLPRAPKPGIKLQRKASRTERRENFWDDELTCIEEEEEWEDIIL